MLKTKQDKINWKTSIKISNIFKRKTKENDKPQLRNSGSIHQQLSTAKENIKTMFDNLFFQKEYSN